MVAIGRRKQGVELTLGSRIAQRASTIGRRGRAAGTRGAADGAEIAAALRGELERAERLSGELVATMAHDIRNPLSVVLVSTKLLTRALGPGHAGQRHVDAIHRAANEINQTIQDISDASLLERDAFAFLSPEPFDLVAGVERAVVQARQLAASRNVEIDYAAPGGIEPLFGDGERMSRVAQTLIAGAVRASQRGGRVGVRLEATGHGAARLTVTDGGPGLAPQHEHLLFARSAGDIRPAPQGVGLSAFVARGVVEAHGGRIFAENAAEGGAVFGFEVPVSPSAGA